MSDETKSCYTCVYMATHEHCDDCLHSKEDVEQLRQGHKMPGFRYLNWASGNWMARRIRFEREGRCTIVIGGQGEADLCCFDEPQAVSTNLHRVAEQCGYICGTLRQVDDRSFLRICTTEGVFEVEWCFDADIDKRSFDHVWRLDHIWHITNDGDGKEVSRESTWDWSDGDIFPAEASEPELVA